MIVLEFCLGLALGLVIGVLLMEWHQIQSSKKVKALLRDLKPDAPDSPLSFSSQLSLAIARQQKLHQQLEQQVESYRQVINIAPIGYLQVDDENQLLWYNHQALEMLGIPVDQPPKLPRLLLEVVRSYELDHLIEETRSHNKPRQRDWTLYPVSAD
ncbi:MAG TPA: PAS domain-containing protein, partial [Chroococcidiopsis sp.]